MLPSLSPYSPRFARLAGPLSNSRKTAWLLRPGARDGGSWRDYAAHGIPVMPATWIRYTRALHLTSENTETAKTVRCRSSTRTDLVARPGAESRGFITLWRRRSGQAGIFCNNYGELARLICSGRSTAFRRRSAAPELYFWDRVATPVTF